MHDDVFVTKDDTQVAERKFCPLLKTKCMGNECQFWVRDYMEDRRTTRVDCAVAMIATALTDEALAKLQGGKS
ncbi:MAG: hypothetical protein P9L99_18490 [Candidatus Lernaella stagnicola]|nr:hypothetical protein [Candidatus Lernaella stagnicola]